jgi:hypothetical protein
MNTLNKVSYIALLSIIAFTFSGCSKKSTPFDNNPVATRTLRYLTQSAWKETKIEYQNQNGSWTSMPVPSVVLSQITTFYTNGSYTVASGGTTTTGVYDIIGDNTQLAINKTTTYDFSILNDTTMQLLITAQIPYTDPSSGITTTYFGFRQTFGH